MQCFDTFHGLLHKLYAATTDGKGREGTYNFSHDDWGKPRLQGIGQRGKLPPDTRWCRAWCLSLGSEKSMWTKVEI